MHTINNSFLFHGMCMCRSFHSVSLCVCHCRLLSLSLHAEGFSFDILWPFCDVRVELCVGVHSFHIFLRVCHRIFIRFRKSFVLLSSLIFVCVTIFVFYCFMAHTLLLLLHASMHVPEGALEFWNCVTVDISVLLVLCVIFFRYFFVVAVVNMYHIASTVDWCRCTLPPPRERKNYTQYLRLEKKYLSFALSFLLFVFLLSLSLTLFYFFFRSHFFIFILLPTLVSLSAKVEDRRKCE